LKTQAQSYYYVMEALQSNSIPIQIIFTDNMITRDVFQIGSNLYSLYYFTILNLQILL